MMNVHDIVPLSVKIGHGLEGDGPAQGIIEQQDREIAERSGKSRGPIRAIERVDAKKAKAQGKSNNAA